MSISKTDLQEDCFQADSLLESCKNFFSSKTLDSLAKVCEEIDKQQGALQPSIASVFKRFIDESDKEKLLATRSLQMIQAINASSILKGTTYKEIFKVGIAAAVFLEKNEDAKKEFFLKKKETKLASSLLFDCSRKAISVLPKGELIADPDKCTSYLYIATEFRLLNDGFSVEHKKVIQKLSQHEKKPISQEEIRFTKAYGNGLSSIEGYCTKHPLKAMMTLEALDLDLHKKLKIGPLLSPDEKIIIAYDIFKTLARMHEERVIHYDIKEQNILIRYKDNGMIEASLCDFGLSFDGGLVESLSLWIYGTPRHSAPELWESDITKERATIQEYKAFDMFALGLVLFSLSCGFHVLPFYKSDLEKPWCYRLSHLQARKNNVLAGPDYTQQMKSRLEKYMKELGSERKNLHSIFSGKTQELFSHEELLAYLAWRLLEEDPLKRLTAKEGRDLLSSFRQRIPN